MLLKFFYYDEELQIYIDRSTKKVQYLERKAYCTKILLMSLVCLLAVIIVIMLFNKMLG